MSDDTAVYGDEDLHLITEVEVSDSVPRVLLHSNFRAILNLHPVCRLEAQIPDAAQPPAP